MLWLQSNARAEQLSTMKEHKLCGLCSVWACRKRGRTSYSLPRKIINPKPRKSIEIQHRYRKATKLPPHLVAFLGLVGWGFLLLFLVGVLFAYFIFSQAELRGWLTHSSYPFKQSNTHSTSMLQTSYNSVWETLHQNSTAQNTARWAKGSGQFICINFPHSEVQWEGGKNTILHLVCNLHLKHGKSDRLLPYSNLSTPFSGIYDLESSKTLSLTSQKPAQRAN